MMNLEQLRRLRPNLERRAALFSSIRRTFTGGGFLEVETDTAIPAPAPEEFIESIPAGAKFLRAIPEIAMKNMVCAGYEKIFQILKNSRQIKRSAVNAFMPKSPSGSCPPPPRR